MNFDFEIGQESTLMNWSKSSKLSAGCKLVQRHRVVRVTLEKILFSIFLNFVCQTQKGHLVKVDQTVCGTKIRPASPSQAEDIQSCPRVKIVLVQ